MAENEKKEYSLEDLRQDTEQKMMAAHKDKSAVWLLPKEMRDHIKAPVLVIKHKEGNLVGRAIPLTNYAPLLQAQKDKGMADSRYIRANTAFSLGVQYDPKDVEHIVRFDRNKKPYVDAVINLAAVKGKGLEALQKAVPERSIRTSADRDAANVLFHLNQREENKTFEMRQTAEGLKENTFTALNIAACNLAVEDYKKRKQYVADHPEEFAPKEKAPAEKKEPKAPSPERIEHDKRVEAIVSFTKDTKLPAGDKAFLLAMQANYAKDKKTYVTKAIGEMLTEKKMADKKVKDLVTKYAPGAAYDAEGKEPYADKMLGIAKGQMEKGASR